jgi:hypothetical protein
MVKKSITVAEAGRKGGQKTAATHGREFYSEIGRKGGQKTVSLHGPDYFSKLVQHRWNKQKIAEAQ